jgi:acetyl/propionyl-CoA carboxylase alpha subunit
VAIGRLQRALDEYRVVGVRTTLPFFRWLVRRPEFAAADFTTTYLDQLLADRQEAFVVPSEADRRDAIVASALAAWWRAHGAAPLAATSQAWRRAARLVADDLGSIEAAPRLYGGPEVDPGRSVPAWHQRKGGAGR